MKRLIICVVITCCISQISAMKRISEDDLESSVVLLKHFKLNDGTAIKPWQPAVLPKRKRLSQDKLPKPKRTRRLNRANKRDRINNSENSQDKKRPRLNQNIWDIIHAWNFNENFKNEDDLCTELQNALHIGKFDLNEKKQGLVLNQSVCFTPLTYFISQRKEKLVALLLHAQANPNLESDRLHITMVAIAHIESESPLSLAIKLNHIGIIKLLLDHKAHFGQVEHVHARCYANADVKEVLNEYIKNSTPIMYPYL